MTPVSTAYRQLHRDLAAGLGPRPDLQALLSRLYRLEEDLLAQGSLPRILKEYIVVALAAEARNLFRTATHCCILRQWGVSENKAEQIALDHRHAELSQQEHALLDCCLSLYRSPERFPNNAEATLLATGLSAAQCTEAVLVATITALLNAIEPAMGLQPAVPLGVRLPASSRYPLPSVPRPADDGDPDWPLVERVRDGDTAAFEELVRRHGKRVHRTIAGILTTTADIEDAVQNCFLNAFEHIAGFAGRSRFSTWITRIAVNTALQQLRARPTISIDTITDQDGDTRPREIRAWRDDPEQAYSREELRARVLDAIMELPGNYRIVVMLRDLQERSTEETAEILGLGIPAVKSRLFRGRMMLREALSPHFLKHQPDQSYV